MRSVIPHTDDKAAIRLKAAEERAAIDAETRRAAAEAAADVLFSAFNLVQLCKQGPLSAFWPVAVEFDSVPILMRAHQAGIPLCLPVVERRYKPLIFRTWDPSQTLETGPYNIYQPTLEAEQVTPRVMIVPLMAFTRAGDRIGYGGGYFDQTIRELRDAGPLLTIGLAYASQEMAKLPVDPHDQRLDWVVTEKEAIECRNGR